MAFLSSDASRLFVDLRPDGRVFAFTAALAVLTCVLFGLAPPCARPTSLPARR